MTALAYVNHGRWVADCPTTDCPEAHLAQPGDKFDCVNCGTVGRVEFPDNHTDIDEVLERRPVPQTRNWTPGESLEELVEENRAHDLDT